uniref:UDP-glycosyltransferase 79B6-like n=1 Tax=Rhizophora mucronata TaxID=61149 RepID=A0A2P2IRA6_RHIMU
MWESLLSNCQIVLVPHLLDQIIGTMLMAEELGVAVEAKREENGLVSRKNLSTAIKLVMDKDSELATKVNANHAKWRNIVSGKDMQDRYVDNFMKDLQGLTS